MPYARENNDLRLEVRASAPTTYFPLWPKVNGSIVSPSSTGAYQIRSPSDVLLASGTVTATEVSTGNWQFLIPVGPLTELGEDYQIRVAWSYAGDEYLDVVQFDVVLWPWGRPSVSLNDLQEERPDIGDILDRLGDRLGLSPEDMAGVFAVRALVELDALVRDQIAAGVSTAPRITQAPGTELSSRYTRPYLILNRERLNRVERKLAMQLIYAADMSAPGGDDESAALFAHYKAEAASAFRSIGPLRYANPATPLTVDTELEDMGRVVHLRREQA